MEENTLDENRGGLDLETFPNDEDEDLIKNEIINGEIIEPQFATVDEIFEKIGPCGAYQFTRGFVLCILAVPMTYQILIMYFTGHSPNWKCVNGTNTACNITGEISPAEVDQFKSRCSMPRHSWEYTTPKTFSFITEFDLVCDKNPLAAFANSAMYIGWGIGCLPLGIAADYLGRKPILFISYTAVLSSLLVSSFVTSVWQFVILRGVLGFFLTGHGISSFVLGSEIVGRKFRSLIGNVIFVVGTGALLLLTLQAYFLQEWRKLTIICSAPYLACILMICCINESPRWLSSQGKLAKSMKVMKKMASVNGRSFPNQQIVQSGDIKRARGSFVNLFRPFKRLCITVPLSFGWMVVSMTFYGISLAAGDLSGNMYRDFALVSLIEFPSMPVTVALLEKLGRKKTTVVSMVAAGIFCMSVIIFPEKSANKVYPMLRTAAGMAGKFCNVIAFSAYYVWTGELHPTTIRTQGLSFASLFARVGASPAPFITEVLKLVSPSLPFILMGVLSIIAGFVSLSLPETMGRPTLESFDIDYEDSQVHTNNDIAMSQINDTYVPDDSWDVDQNENDALMTTNTA